METRTVERVEGWPARPVSDGFDGLWDLVEESFSGAVSCDSAWLFMLNGRVVGVFDGRLDAFADAQATAYEAPDPALPLLFSMLERGGTPRGQYYSEKTRLEEVDGTLSEGGFTGYVELSENVLSGDYYVVYYGGRSMSAAFVGASEKLLTGEEAFDRAADEVGIYEVVDVEVEIVDLPEPEPEPADSVAPGAPPPADGSADDPGREPRETDERTDEPAGANDGRPADPAESAGDPADPDADPTTDADAAATADRSTTVDDTAAGDDASVADDSTAGAGPADGQDSGAGTAASGPDGDRRSAVDASSGNGTDGPTVEAAPDGTPAGPDDDSTGSSADGPTGASADGAGVGASGEVTRTDDDVFSEEEQWREARTIPALDPEESESAPGRTRESTGAAESRPAVGGRRQPEPSGTPDVADLRRAVEERERRLHELQERLAEAEAEREELVAERDRLRAELESARAELSTVREELESARDRLERARRAEPGDDDGRPPADSGLSAADALAGTNLFVRYDSKGEPTLESARDDGATRESVDGNLRIEHHTSFEADRTTVEGEPYGEFLRGTLEYRFVDWFVRELLYEIRESGHRAGLADLFAAIPEVDRAQLHGAVTVRPDDEEGEPTERAFDVVLRDKMGRPLVVADLSTGRSPVTADAMGSLVDYGTAVSAGSDRLAAAFFVTSSFFRPDALESASEATGGSFLSRDKRESFVHVGRKRGYHLCLVEARDATFHVSIPEL